MKSPFKTTWNASTQTRKQRKFRHNAPHHTKSKLLHANLAQDLRDKHKTRSARVRGGDEVEVMRGSFKGVKGLVESVDVKNEKLIIRGVERPKMDGGKTPYPVAVSNVRITKLTSDKRRFKNNG